MGNLNQPSIIQGRSLERVAVLCSGGLDSCVLLAQLAGERQVFPLYVEGGLAWEGFERLALDSYLEAIKQPNVSPLSILEMPVRNLYGDHWSTTGKEVPDANTPDSSVYLPGRNVLLLGLAAVWGAINDVSDIVIGSLDHNPFPDATPEFFADYSRLLTSSLSHETRISAPFRTRTKAEIIGEFSTLPLELTLTCISPRSVGMEAGLEILHCGICNKCRERQEAFLSAGVPDRTLYAASPPALG